jgi:hypothetical protein
MKVSQQKEKLEKWQTSSELFSICKTEISAMLNFWAPQHMLYGELNGRRQKNID